MAFTPEEKRAYREKQKSLLGIFDILKARDEASGKIRYKSEVFDLVTLGKIFMGQPWREEDEDVKKKKTDKTVDPSSTGLFGSDKPRYENLDDFVAAFYNWLEFRDRARKDLYWLCSEVMHKNLYPDVHQQVCDQFVKKDFDGAFPAGYTIGDVHNAIDRQIRVDEDGNPTKEMMLLFPRGFYKSTIDGIDAVQWIINVPDIRILLLTGEYKLGIGFLKEIKSYFYLPEGGEPEDFHLLFPEYIVKGVDGTSKEPLTIPVRKHTQVSATIWVNSIDSNLSGWHCDIKKGDDVVTDSNSNTEDTRTNLKEKYDGTDNIVDPWGFMDHIGTRYYVDDWYGTRLKSYYESPEENALKYFCKACWTVKPEYADVSLKNLEEHMVICTFPQKESFKKLRKKLLNNERSFRCQQLNEPQLSGENEDLVNFDEDMLRNHIYQMSAAPTIGDVFICWDWALSTNKYSDLSAGLAGRVYFKEKDALTGQDIYGISILDCVYGRWRASELAIQIVAFNKKWNPKKTLIERANGAELLNMEIARKAAIYGTSLDIFWLPVSTQANAKRNRIKSLEVLLASDRLYFVAGSWNDEMIRQAVKYTGQKKNLGRKEDIIDAMSFLQYFLPAKGGEKEPEEMKALVKEQKERAMRKMIYNRLFGPEAQVNIQVDEPQRPADPRNTIFGNNGMHI